MRVAVLFDVHGNLPALEAVLAAAETEGFDRLLLGGDYALNGPAPAACVDRLRAYGERLAPLQGNTDRWIAEGRDDDGVRWTTAALGPERVAWLRGLPTRLELPEADALVVHATPRSDEEQLYPDTAEPEVRAMLAAVERRLVLCGHTHVQYRRTLPPWTVVNPGSVGFPDDGDQASAWALLDGATLQLRRTPYRVEETIDALQASDSPVRDRSVRRLRTARPA